MKTVIVFYSMSGNTAVVARKLAEMLSADLIEIRPERAYPDKGFRKFFLGGKSAVMEEAPMLEAYSFPSEKYERVIFGFPVWASNMAPPLRTFIMDNLDVLKNKDIAAFACQGGAGAEKALRKLAVLLERDSLSAAMILNNPGSLPVLENNQKLQAFLAQLK